eukprot:scaffold587_cov339-Pavlova_lutheri.AAC.53
MAVSQTPLERRNSRSPWCEHLWDPPGAKIDSSQQCRHERVDAMSASEAKGADATSSLGDFTAVDIDGKTRNLSEFVGKVSLVVNVASE